MNAETVTQIILDVYGEKANALIPGRRYECIVEELDRERTARRIILRELPQ